MPLVTPTFLQPLLQRPVAVFGGGVSGQGVLALLEGLGQTSVIYDARGLNFCPAAAKQHALVVFSPGFAPEHPWLEIARKAGLTCLGELDFTSCYWRGQVLAITGTNGKTTLTELMAHALNSVGIDAEAAGNIGRPLSRLVAETGGGDAASIAVCEVSSFQAETLQYLKPDATLWTNFAEDHLDRHAGMPSYFKAKWNLVERTRSGAVFAGDSVAAFAAQLGLAMPQSTVAPTSGTADVRLAGTVFAESPQRENFLLASAWWQASGRDESALVAAARTFQLGRHRLARVGEWAGVTYWNDSKATNFHAVEAALARFSSPVLLIAGGKAKGGDLEGFIRRIVPQVKHAFLIGDTKAMLASFCQACHLGHTMCATLAEAVQSAANRAVTGDTVLLSPGFASFDLFRSYEDRGEQFEKLVRGLGTVTSLR